MAYNISQKSITESLAKLDAIEDQIKKNQKFKKIKCDSITKSYSKHWNLLPSAPSFTDIIWVNAPMIPSTSQSAITNAQPTLLYRDESTEHIVHYILLNGSFANLQICFDLNSKQFSSCGTLTEQHKSNQLLTLHLNNLLFKLEAFIKQSLQENTAKSTIKTYFQLFLKTINWPNQIKPVEYI